MNNILVTGAAGQLGSEIRVLSKNSQQQFYFTDVDELDITDLEAITRFVKNNQIGIIINCAAYTQVDRAEDDAERARLINAEAVKKLAQASREHDALLIHISTDYVFDGSRNTPYSEQVETSPLGVYGKTKLEGEQAVVSSGCKYIIIRTSWLYSSFGNNFVKTMQRLTAERDTLQVVFDQTGTPTFAADLAVAILQIVDDRRKHDKTGIYHFSNEGVCSWYDFAVEIAKEFNHTCRITPCYSEEFPSKVERPAYSVLDKSKIKKTFNIAIPHWRDSLMRCTEILKKEN